MAPLHGSPHAEAIRRLLSAGPGTANALSEQLGLSQPTVSRAIRTLGDEVVRIGAARALRYALRDERRGYGEVPVYRVDAQGRVVLLGQLCPVRPEGHVFREVDTANGSAGRSSYFEGLPWWLMDMRPQGFLGRAFAARYAPALSLPGSLSEWTDAHALRALLAHGRDAVGNLLLGHAARDAFVQATAPVAIAADERAHRYTRLAAEAARGEVPGSSAGGEQPKFTTYAEAEDGSPRHVLVKFTVPEDNPVTRRWRDLLLAEHLALDTLSQSGLVPATRSALIDSRTVDGQQRFLEVERFDRVGPLGRRALHSLASLEAEFVGDATAPWPVLTRRLAEQGHITRGAAQAAELLYAYGTLIGNTDMHHGNLSFISETGRPYELAPAYDMLPMGLAPRTSGALPETLPPPQLRADVSTQAWRLALPVARIWLNRLKADTRLSASFGSCLTALQQHLDTATRQLDRLG